MDDKIKNKNSEHEKWLASYQKNTYLNLDWSVLREEQVEISVILKTDGLITKQIDSVAKWDSFFHKKIISEKKEGSRHCFETNEGIYEIEPYTTAAQLLSYYLMLIKLAEDRGLSATDFRWLFVQERRYEEHSWLIFFVGSEGEILLEQATVSNFLTGAWRFFELPKSDFPETKKHILGETRLYYRKFFEETRFGKALCAAKDGYSCTPEQDLIALTENQCDLQKSIVKLLLIIILILSVLVVVLVISSIFLK